MKLNPDPLRNSGAAWEKHEMGADRLLMICGENAVAGDVAGTVYAAAGAVVSELRALREYLVASATNQE